jgi:hypothetical protein
MSRIKAKKDFVRFSVLLLIEFIRIIIDKMMANPSFPNPDIPIADLKQHADDLETAYQNADDGSRYHKSLMRKIKLESVDGLRKQSDYVNRIADGDESIVISSGFHPTKPWVRPVKHDFELLAGPNHGEIIMFVRPVDKAKAYVWMYSLAGDPLSEEGWVFAGSSTKARASITGLESGKLVWCRCCAVTSTGHMPWCEPLSKIVP